MNTYLRHNTISFLVELTNSILAPIASNMICGLVLSYDKYHTLVFKEGIFCIDLNKKKLTLERNLIFLDGFISSLGCQDQERVGHLYRGRDCENNVVENVFERKCYCRYHRCNHKDYYYSHSIKMNHSIILLLFTFCLTSLI